MDEAMVAALVERARAGDSGAFGELYEHCRPQVLRLCRHFLGSPAAAEDAASEVFLKVRRSLEGYDRSRPFTQWLLRIAANCCIDALRRSRTERRLFPVEREEAMVEPATSADVSPLEQVIAAEQRAELGEAMQQLPEHYRRVLVLRYGAELSYDEIAKAAGLERNNVAVLIFRAKKELRRVLSGRRTR